MRVKLFLLYFYCKIRCYDDFRIREKITRLYGGFWGSVVWEEYNFIVITPRKYFKLFWIGTFLSDGIYIENTTKDFIKCSFNTSTLESLIL